MQVLYKSTRGKEETVTASMAILKGLSEDGGLFVPTEIPKLDVPMDELAKMSYQETAYEVMKCFLTDFTEEELKNCINNAYDEKFDTKVTVKGLKKVKTVDIFKDLELKFEGTAPDLSTESEIIIEQDDASFWCTVSPCEDLDIGDEITIECTTEGMVNGIKPEKLKTTVKVPDTAEHYVTDPSELTAEDMQEIKDGLTKMLKGEEPYEDRLDHSWMAIKSLEDVTDNNLEFYSRETASNITFSDTAEYFVNESYNEYTENVTDMLIRFELDDTVEDEESDKCGKTYHIYGYTILGPIVRCSDGKLQIEDDWDGIVFYISGTMGNVREKVEKDINEEVDKIMRDAPTRYVVAFDGSGKVEQIK